MGNCMMRPFVRIASTNLQGETMPDEAPDIYTDGMNMLISPYGVNLIFQKSPSHPGLAGQQQSDTVAVIRMSLEHAKVLCMMLRKQLKQYELESLGDPINLPRSLLASINLTLEEW